MKKKNILVVVRPEYKDKIISTIEKKALTIDYDNIQNNDINDVQIAFIDEDFNSLNNGWNISRMLRASQSDIKIIMIVKTTPISDDINNYYDVLMYFSSISEEEIHGEIMRE